MHVLECEWLRVPRSDRRTAIRALARKSTNIIRDVRHRVRSKYRSLYRYSAVLRAGSFNIFGQIVKTTVFSRVYMEVEVCNVQKISCTNARPRFSVKLPALEAQPQLGFGIGISPLQNNLINGVY